MEIVVTRSAGVLMSSLLLGIVAGSCGRPAGKDPPSIRNPDGLQLVVANEHASPTLRIVLPGAPASERAIEVIFPEHVTAVRHGSAAAEQLYRWRPGPQGDRPVWRRRANALEYERDLPGAVHLLARATLEADGVRFRYEFRNAPTVAYDLIYAVTDPRVARSKTPCVGRLPNETRSGNTARRWSTEATASSRGRALLHRTPGADRACDPRVAATPQDCGDDLVDAYW
jgi:hypothetical protein